MLTEKKRIHTNLCIHIKTLHAVLYSIGTESWPPGVCLKYIGGDQFGHVNMVMVRSLEPQEISDVSVQMHSPANPGMYQGQWRMCTATGLFYGGEAPYKEDAQLRQFL